VRVTDGAISEVEFAPCDVLRFLTVEVDIGAQPDLGTLNSSVIQAVQDARTKHGAKHLVLRVILTGSGALYADLRRERVLEEMLEELRHLLQHESPVLWLESIRNTARPALDLDAVAKRGDFSAELLHLARTYQEDQAKLSQFFAERLRVLQKSKVRSYLEPCMLETEQQAVLQEAMQLALDLVEEGLD